MLNECLALNICITLPSLSLFPLPQKLEKAQSEKAKINSEKEAILKEQNSASAEHASLKKERRRLQAERERLVGRRGKQRPKFMCWQQRGMKF